MRYRVGYDAIGRQAVKQTLHIGDNFLLDGAKGIVEQGGIALLVDEGDGPPVTGSVEPNALALAMGTTFTT